ncbi:MAG: thioesterase family protein [Bacteroidota bacterium]
MALQFPDKTPLFSYTHKLRSRYGETDQMGYVYHGRFLEYFEVARTEMIRSAGVTYRELEASGVMLPVIDAQLEFKVPVEYDEEMEIRVLLFDQPGVRLITYYQVYTPRFEQPNVRGRVTLCFMDSEHRRPIRAPEAFMKQFVRGLSE